jgi:hypothetical protein
MMKVSTFFRRRMWRRRAAAIVFTTLIACGKSQAGTDTAPTTTPSETSAAAPPPAVGPCDAEGVWSADFPENGDDAALAAHKRAVTQRIKAWIPECRKKALVALCQYGCDSGDDAISDVLIDASPTPPEQQAALKYRLERNALRATKWRDLYSKTKGIVDHALAIQASPRSSTYAPANPTAEQMADQIANGDPCMRRMKVDDTKIYAIVDELDHEVDGVGRGDTVRFLQAPVVAPLRGLLTQAHSCGDCGDSRSSCKSLRSDLKEAEDELLAFEKQIASDKKQVTAGTSPLPSK